MANEELYELCDACIRLLGRLGEEINFPKSAKHHRDIESLERALRLRCYLCSFTYTEPSQPFVCDRIAHERVDSYTLVENERITFGLSNDHPVRVLKLVPWQTMGRDDLPALLSSNTGAPSALDFLAQKYAECVESHQDCKLQRLSSLPYPTRLIDVGNLDDEHIRLQETGQSCIQEPYFCLSHCWGKVQPLKLTLMNVRSLQDGIALDTLPKTFRDAIFVTRTLGVRYLWIDSLCIFQDNLDDWAVEASRMRDVYRNAACTIAATASTDSTQGLFFDRDPWLVRPRRLTSTCASEYLDDEPSEVHHYWSDHEDFWFECVEKAPLNRRGWVYQERHLSRRIMHFTATQLFWECHECKACENYPSELPEWTRSESEYTFLKQKIKTMRKRATAPTAPQGPSTLQPPASVHTPEELNSLYKTWVGWRRMYSRSLVTKDEDKLAALQGISQDVNEILDDRLVAGMWETRMLDELCYKTELPDFGASLSSRKLPGPSWSWASTKQHVLPGLAARVERPGTPLANVVGIDIPDAPFNGPRWATLQLECKVLSVTATWGATNAADLLHSNARLENHQPVDASRLQNFTLERTSTYLDCAGKRIFTDDPFVDAKDRPRDVHMVVMQHHVSDWMGDSDERYEMVEVLLLSRRPVPEQAYERIGCETFRGDDCRRFLAEHAVSELKIITLV